MYQRFPEHPRLQLRGCSHRDLPQRGIKEAPDDRPGIRRSDGSDLPGNNVLKATLRDRCGRRAPHGIRHLPDCLCTGGGKEEKIRDELLKYNNFKPVQDSFYGCPAFFVAVFAVFLTFIFTGDLYLLPLSNA